LIVFSGTRASGLCSASPAASDDHAADRGADRRQRDRVRVEAEGDDDEDDLEALEEDALEAHDEGEPVEAQAALLAGGRAASTSSRKVSSSSCSALRPAARRIALRSHCRPKMSSSEPTTSCSSASGSQDFSA
jgi:hypothetical protein